MRPHSSQTSIQVWMIDRNISAYGAFSTTLRNRESRAQFQPILEECEPHSFQADHPHPGSWVDNLITLGLMMLILTTSSLILGWALEKTAQGIVTLTQHTLSELH